ncbi:hypothetical protein EAG_12769 [Camponotus floridanus]|uniref:Uncharacterized protein n=1 Tax=Camponotus floridanus TaxID=104421 RepID=E2AZH1_CAMFO|nr:hypothetical protein EAG_12769 [Camponotus floridanus]
MTDSSRHTCRGRPMVCPGSCNPLRAHQCHHHHHHRRRQKYDVATGTSRNIPLSDEFTPMLLKSLKPDIPDTSAISTKDESISKMSSSFARIALIKVAPSPRAPRPEESDISAILREILTQKKLEKLGEPSTSEPPLLRKIDTTIPTRAISYPKGTIVRIAANLAPRTLDMKCIIAKKLNGLTPKVASSLLLYLMIFIIYAGIHVLLAVITWRTSAYQFFASSQICGLLAFLMWRITGTILI